MNIIIGGRGTGKTKEMLESARKLGAAIITQDKRAFSVKAKSYGYEDIKIIDYEDLDNDDYNLTRPVIIHNGDKMLQWLMDEYYGLRVVGFTATKEGE